MIVIVSSRGIWDWRTFFGARFPSISDTCQRAGDELLIYLEQLQKFRSRGLLCLSYPPEETRRSFLVAPAQEISANVVNEIITLGKGIIFVAVSHRRAKKFENVFRDVFAGSSSAGPPLSSVVGTNAHLGTVLSVEARSGVSTGISAADRATTISALGAPSPDPESIVRPGHVFLWIEDERDEVRRGFCRAAHDAIETVGQIGMSDAAVISDILDDEGNCINGSELHALIRGIPLIEMEEPDTKAW